MSACIVFIAQLFLAMFQVLAYLRTIGMLFFALTSGTFVILLARFMMKYLNPVELKDDPDLKDGWFGRGPKPIDATVEDCDLIRPFNINVKEEVLEDLKERLSRTRYEEPMEGSQFTYGMNSNYLKEIVDFWMKKFDWRKQEAALNKFPHFITKIEGIDVHFVHVKPEVSKNIRVIPIMIIHGWPGCFAEFCKIIPLLTTPTPSRDFVFEVVCPSIPGFAFSEAPHKPGMTTRAVGRIFVKLMERIGHKQFYAQGGDWGSIISTHLAKFQPERIKGLHVTMFGFLSLWEMLKVVLVALFPFVLSSEEYKLFYPLRRKLNFLYKESGYFHIQSTKPDTLGCGMADSPAGMAAYLLEKFSVATNVQYRKRDDGGLTEKFTMDELLTICTIYWVTRTFTSAARFYKENSNMFPKFEKYPVNVPTAIAAFPNEVLMFPRMMMTHQLRNIVSYNIMQKGGHFAAMEEPHLLAQDIWDFVEIVEHR